MARGRPGVAMGGRLVADWWSKNTRAIAGGGAWARERRKRERCVWLALLEVVL